MTHDDLPVDQLLARTLAAAGGAAWARVRTLHFEGRAQAGGLSGPFDQWIELATGRHATRLALGPATSASGFDGAQAWQCSANGEVVVQDAHAARRAAATEAWIHARGWWFADRRAAMIESLGRRDADGTAFDVLRFEAYRQIDGLRLPMRIASGNGDARFDRVTEIATVAIDETPPADAFDVPPQAFDDVTFLVGETSARVDIELLDNHVFVPVQIAGRALRFMLDTGGVTLLAASAAQRLGLASAVALERPLLRVPDMPGFDDVEGTRVDGVLGVELFKRLVVRIDDAARTLLLAPFVEEHGQAARYAATPLTTIGWGVGGRAQGRLARGGRLVLWAASSSRHRCCGCSCPTAARWRSATWRATSAGRSCGASSSPSTTRAASCICARR